MDLAAAVRRSAWPPGAGRGGRGADLGGRLARLDDPDGRRCVGRELVRHLRAGPRPGLLVGALIGLAEHRRRTGGSRTLWLALSPCLFLVALADPAIFELLITQGIGGGAIGVVRSGSRADTPSPDVAARGGGGPAACFAVLGVLLMTVLASDTAPLETAHGLWVGLYAASLLAVLMLACALPQRIGRASLVPARWIATAVGAVCGFAWAAALRAFMWEVAGDDAGVEWAGTFVWVLLPGAIIGALLAWAEHRRWTGSRAARALARLVADAVRGGPVPESPRPSGRLRGRRRSRGRRRARVRAWSVATRSPATGRSGSAACAGWSRSRRSRSGP